MPGEERGDREAMQGGERNELHKEDRDLFMRSVRGKEEEKRCKGAGRNCQSCSRLACLSAGTTGAKTPSPDNAAETMEDAGKPWK